MKKNFECKLSKKHFSGIVLAFPKSEKITNTTQNIIYGIFITIIELLSE